MLNRGTFNSFKYNSTFVVETVVPEVPIGGSCYEIVKKPFKLQYTVIGKRVFEFTNYYNVVGKRKISIHDQYKIFALKKIKFDNFLNGVGKSKHSQLLKLKCRANKQFSFDDNVNIYAKRQFLINEKILFCGKIKKSTETKMLIKAKKDITNILEALDLID